MTVSSRRERNVRLVVITLILGAAIGYVSQGLLIHLRLGFVDAKPITPQPVANSCNEQECFSKWRLQPEGRFLLLGHIMRTHSLTDELSSIQVLPVSRVRGITADSWSGLRVYEVSPGKTYVLEARKPAAVKMDHFVGVMPRTSNHEGVLSVPDISPTISTITSLIGFSVLGILLFAAFLAPASGLEASSNRQRLIVIAVSALSAAVVSIVSTGMIDSLFPDGDIRSRILRTAAVVAVALPPLSDLIRSRSKSVSLSVVLAIGVCAFAINFNWQYFRAGEVWIYCYAGLVISMSVYLFKHRNKLAALVTLVALLDFIRMMGLLPQLDSPPIYVFQSSLVASFSLVVSDLGATSIISLAAKAYQRFSRDIELSRLSEQLSFEGELSSVLSSKIRDALPTISRMTGANRTSILINLPSARPITHSFDAVGQSFVTHDDGKIPGAVAVRAFVYGDEAWFERYDAFSMRLGIPSSPHLVHANHVCIVPIRVNQVSMGVLMLTCFDDDRIGKLNRNGEIEEEKETGRLIVDLLSSRFSDIVIHSMKSSSSLASEVLSKIRDAIPTSASTQDFLERVCQVVSEALGMRTMLHEQVGEAGVARAQFGFAEKEWGEFVVAPFNLSPTAKKAFGSTVVAFREQKSSYIKDWHEIHDKLHPKTVEILSALQIATFLAVPLSANGSKFVITCVSRRGDPSRDPGLIKIVESIEAIFDAAVTVFNQRTSVLALGKLANRLIGDDDVRNKIIDAAKQESLQTTIGTPRTSFLFLLDLAGSSQLPADTEDKARSYGIFYDEVNKVSQALLGGKVRKTIGDAIIVTWDGTGHDLSKKSEVLEGLRIVVSRANDVAIEVGCKGVRAVLHHGDYFFGLIGTSSFGQIDVIGKGIDEVCKLEGAMKLMTQNGLRIRVGISSAAAARLEALNEHSYVSAGFSLLESKNMKPSDLCWAQFDGIGKEDKKVS